MKVKRNPLKAVDIEGEISMSLNKNVAQMSYSEAIDFANNVIETYEENHAAMNVYSPVNLRDIQILQRNLQQHSFFQQGREVYDKCQEILERDGGQAFKPRQAKKILSDYQVEQRRLRGEFGPL